MKCMYSLKEKKSTRKLSDGAKIDYERDKKTKERSDLDLQQNKGKHVLRARPDPVELQTKEFSAPKTTTNES